MDGIQELFDIRDDQLLALQDSRLKLLQAGSDLIDLSMINPDLSPDRTLTDALVQSVLKPHNHRYAVSRGIRKLRSAFALKYSQRFGVKLDPHSQCVVTMGAKEATNLSLMALPARDKKVLIGTPLYPAFRAAAAMSAREVETFSITNDPASMLAEIEAKVKAGGISTCLFNFPNNPTSIMIGVEFWKRMLLLAEKYDLFLLNDFTYGEMSYRAEASSLLAQAPGSQRIAEIYSLSKAYNVPGWRVGALLGSSELVGKIAQIKSYLDYGNFLPIQQAASVALTGANSIPTTLSLKYERRARLLVDGLKKLGWGVEMPLAGACLWAKLPARLHSHKAGQIGRSYLAAGELLARHGIFALPGEIFGSFPDFIRFALVIPEERIRQLLSRFDHCESESQELGLSTPA